MSKTPGFGILRLTFPGKKASFSAREQAVLFPALPAYT
jgi:hypothetical protein